MLSQYLYRYIALILLLLIPVVVVVDFAFVVEFVMAVVVSNVVIFTAFTGLLLLSVLLPLSCFCCSIVLLLGSCYLYRY